MLILVCTLTAQVKTGGTSKIGGVTKRASTAGGGCSFPCSAILDNFNRANGGPPPSASWTTAWRPSTTGFTVDTNTIVGSTGGDNSTYWNTTFGPDVEVYVTMTDSTSGSYRGLAARLVSEGTSGVDGYEIVAFGNEIFVQRVDDNSNTTLGTVISQTYTIGDSMGMSIIGSTITVYYKVGAGAWTSLGTRTDSTYSAAGKIGLRSENIHWDDFGGGTMP